MPHALQYRFAVRHLSVLALLAASCAAPQEEDSGADLSDELTVNGTASYTITGVQSGKCVDIAGGSTAIHAAAQIAACTGSARQQFRFEDVGSGYFRIHNVNSGLCLDVQAASTTPGASVLQYTCNTGQNQQFRMSDLSSSVTQFIVRHSGQSLDISGQGTADGTPVIQWTTTGTANQQFRLSAVGSGGGGTGGSGGSGGSGGTVGGGGSAGTGGSTGGGSSCNVAPVDPNATQQAKNLLCYLYSVYGKKVLSGQQETSWSNPANDISYYTGNSSIGKAPAILGGDFLYTGTGTASQGTTTSRAQAYWAAGGLTMIRYHMGAPPNADSYANSMLGFTSAQCVNVITSGTSENTSYVSKLNGIAANLQTLQSAGVPVILALFHETQQNGWFWWSKCSSTQFIALYKYTYNYLMNTKGIHNIIRLMPYSGSPTASYYPGKAFVDITGGDTYGTNVPFTGLYSTMRGIGGTTIPLALHETGVVPQPSTMFPSAAPWLLWNVWAGYETSNNTVSTMASAYSSPFTITRDEIPNLK